MMVIKKYRRFLRISFWRVLNEPLSAHAIAMGAAVGTAISFGPTFGFQLIPAIAIAVRYRYSKILAILTVFISNPLTIIPIISFEIFLGDIIWGSIFDANIAKFLEIMSLFSADSIVDSVEIDKVSNKFSMFLELGRDTLLVFVTGSLICSTIAGVITYFIVKPLVEKWRKHKKLVRENQMNTSIPTK